MNLTNDEAHWLAGLLEGEGSFFRGPPSKPRLPVLALEMCDEDVVRRAASSLDHPSVYKIVRHPERGRKPAYRILIRGSRAVSLMFALRPLMGESRRAEIAHALNSYGGTKVMRTGRRPCSIAGCLEWARGRGLCHNHYNAWLKRRGGKAERPTLESLDPHFALTDNPSARRHWLAGLLEGEGTFSPGPPSSPTWCHLVLKMCERDVVEHARRLMGSTPVREIRNQEHPHWRPAYETLIGARRAEALMRELRPLTGKRRQAQIDRAIACRVSFRYLRLIPAPPHCTVQSCCAPHRGRGLCHKHYMRWLRSSGSSAIKESRRTGANMK